MTLTKLSVPQGGGQQALGPYGATEDYVKQQINLLIDQINAAGGAALLLESGSAGVKTSNLSAAGALAGTEEVPIVQSGTTVRTTTQDIADLGGGGGSPTITVGIVPHAGGGQASATQLSYGYNGIDNSGTSDGDSMQMPSAVAGSVVQLFIQDNSTPSRVLNLYAKNGTSDTINGHSNATVFDVVGTQTAPILVCKVNGAWWGSPGPD